MKPPPLALVTLILGASPTAHAQSIEMFPPGPYVAQCRALDVPKQEGGDDDHNNIYFVEVDPSIADGTAAPDFFVHLWDGDNDSECNSSGVEDRGCGSTNPGSSVFEYRLYGGVGAAVDDDALVIPPAVDPASWTGAIIDIDSDPGDETLRTDDDDDTDDDAPEDLRDDGMSLIGVDVDADPGDPIDGMLIYKFVVDGSFGPDRDWNRYEIQVSRDADRTDRTGLRLFAYEITYAGRPQGSGSTWTSFGFRVQPTPGDALDIQTLDLDSQSLAARSRLSTTLAAFDDSQTYESGQQYTGGQWNWSSMNQPDGASGNGVTGATYSTTGQVGDYWVLDVDAAVHYNPFSIRMRDALGTPVTIVHDPVLEAYGDGPMFLAGTGLPKAGSSTLEITIGSGPANAPALLFVSAAAAEVALPNGLVLYVAPPLPFFTFSLGAAGDLSLPGALPAGVPAGDLFVQAFAEASPGSLVHSNGLRVSIVP